MNTGVRMLRKGALLGIYPEGTRSPDGRLYRGKTGVARMALEAGVVVIPCAMIDTEKMQPTGRRIPRLRPRPAIRIGTPLDFSRYEGLAGDRFVERSMTDEIMYELMQLSGQEYVDLYAAKVKAATGATLGFGAEPVRASGNTPRGRPRRRPHPEPARQLTDRCALLLRLRVHRGRAHHRTRLHRRRRRGRPRVLRGVHRVRPHPGQRVGAAQRARQAAGAGRPALAPPRRDPRRIARVPDSAGGGMELWAWMAAYDHVCLAQLWGDMRALPRAIPRFTHDLRQRWEDAGSPAAAAGAAGPARRAGRRPAQPRPLAGIGRGSSDRPALLFRSEAGARQLTADQRSLDWGGCSCESVCSQVAGTAPG